jgi:hypothetical protein
MTPVPHRQSGLSCINGGIPAGKLLPFVASTSAQHLQWQRIIS